MCFDNRIVFALVLAICFMGWPVGAAAQSFPGGCYITAHHDYICNNYQAPSRAPQAYAPDRLPQYTPPPAQAFNAGPALKAGQAQSLAAILRESLTAAKEAAAMQLVPPQQAGCTQVPVLPVPSGGNVVRVSSTGQLNAVLANAKPGDVIMAANGNYSGDFTLSASGSGNNPITVRAENPGGAVFKNSVFTMNGQHGIASGLTFDNGMITVKGDHNRITRNVFKNGKPGGNQSKLNSAVLVQGSHNRVDHNEVANWQRRGLRVVPNARTFGNRFDHNYLHDFWRASARSNAGDALQIGSNGSHTAMNTGTVMEYNLLERMDSDGETLSVKSSGSIIRFNTFKDSNVVNIRHGSNNQLIGNTVINSKALSTHGNNNQVIGNALRNTPLIVKNGDITQEQMQAGRGGHPASKNTLVAGNRVTGSYIGVGIRIPGGNASSGVPAGGTALAGNQGNVQFGQHTGTRTQSSPGVNVPQAVEVTRADVGPAAAGDGVSGGQAGHCGR